jgi:hypothetical protein
MPQGAQEKSIYKIYKIPKIYNSKTELGEQWNCHAEIPDVCGKCFS